VIERALRDQLVGFGAMRVAAAWERMAVACRNLGRPGVASMAIAAVDTALWDLKARLLGLPPATLLDAAHEAVPIYGSGGLTSYTDDRLREQMSGWVEQGILWRGCGGCATGQPRGWTSPPASTATCWATFSGCFRPGR
jgi:L-alanine-DL-glutamate epimerase-like enolase superfamily enzyme